MGFEGASVIFDTWVHPLVMGLEEHLLHMFRDDFRVQRRGRRLALGRARGRAPARSGGRRRSRAGAGRLRGPVGRGAEAELRKIPFFVRGKARRNTERFAAERGLATIGVETLYDAKSHYSR
jgi:light-independent protochlorophyllide reductase subunit B